MKRSYKSRFFVGVAAIFLMAGIAIAGLEYQGPGTCIVTDKDNFAGCLLNNQSWCQVYGDGVCLGP